ncbi:hypothetical protein FG379_002081 [Cryptosporidium bovis]|uniref:uncharacterized protein n=1 Tax=Cryptosporidium bovis TaxID=310047 RepID=UPI003519F3B9|nr:hypothetical protein FG379_002081 [Cryptosporidium bovis]
MKIPIGFVFYCIDVLILLIVCQGKIGKKKEELIEENQVKPSVKYTNPYKNYVIQEKLNNTLKLTINSDLTEVSCCKCFCDSSSNSESNCVSKGTHHTNKFLIYFDCSLPLSCQKNVCCVECEDLELSGGEHSNYNNRYPALDCNKCNFGVEQAIYELPKSHECDVECLKFGEMRTKVCSNCIDSDLTESGRIKNDTEVESEFDDLDISGEDWDLLFNKNDTQNIDSNQGNTSELFRFWELGMYDKNNEVASRRTNYLRMKTIEKRPFNYELIDIPKEVKPEIDAKKNAFINRELYLGLTVNRDDPKGDQTSAVNYINNSFIQKNENFTTENNYVYNYDWNKWENSKKHDSLRDMELKIRAVIRASLGNEDCFNVFANQIYEEKEDKSGEEKTEKISEYKNNQLEHDEQHRAEFVCNLENEKISKRNRNKIFDLIKELENLDSDEDDKDRDEDHEDPVNHDENGENEKMKEAQDEKEEDEKTTCNECDEDDDSELENILKKVLINELKKVVTE